jgi:adenylate cyclase
MGFLHGEISTCRMRRVARLTPRARNALAVTSRLEQPSVVDSHVVSAYRVDAIVGPFTMSGSNASDLIGRSPDRRKLIAVVYADMVGYSRLIGLDDAGTLHRLRALRREVINPAIEKHGGRLVQTGGDSLLIVFDSIDGAVRCTIKVQQQILEYDGDFPPELRIRFRVGINIGDAIADGTDLHGDAVNVAVRLQAECPPGGICVTRPVRDHVQDRLNLAFEELGALSLKNIGRSVEAFVLRQDVDATRVGPALPPSFRPAQIIAATQNFGIANAPRLSVVVLPFRNLSNRSDDDYLADGITDDLTTDLSRITDAFVIARQSAYTYRGKTINVKQVGDELGVRYVLEGSVRRLGQVLRVNAQLTSTESGAHLWADRFDVQVEELGAGQEEIVQRLRSVLGWEMIQAEAARSARERPTNPDALDLTMRAQSLYNQPYSLERFTEIVTLLERAVELDPSSAAARALLAQTLIRLYFDSPEGRVEDRLIRADALLAEATVLTASSNAVLNARAALLAATLRWPEALAAAQRSTELSPNDADALTSLGIISLNIGAAEEAIALFERAIRLDPRGSFQWNRYRRLGYALLVLGREREAIPWLQRALIANPNVPNTVCATMYRLLVAAYARTGHSNDAYRALVKAVQLDPFVTVRSDVPYNGSSDAIAQTRRYQEGLRLAGFRDHADEDADFGVTSDGQLHRAIGGYSPTSAHGATTVRTADLVSFIAHSRPIVIDTMVSFLGRSIPDAIGLRGSGRYGHFSDSAQGRLRRKMQELTKGDMSSPIVAVGWNSERFGGYNLALRLVALGYTNVHWYRGGREAWEVKGLPETDLESQDW